MHVSLSSSRTGILMFGPNEKSGLLEDVVSGLVRHNIEYETFSGSEANRRYPDQLTLPSDYMCIFEKEGGILLADKALAAIQVSVFTFHKWITCVTVKTEVHVWLYGLSMIVAGLKHNE